MIFSSNHITVGRNLDFAIMRNKVAQVAKHRNIVALATVNMIVHGYAWVVGCAHA